MDAARTVQEYAALIRVFGLKLPTGWFGRPYDNLHELTLVEPRRHRLLIELDHRLLLSFAGRPLVAAEGKEASITAFDQLVFDWSEYGEPTPHCKVFSEGGEVRLIG
ncbi:hypothetical protein HJD18_13590 [Thermoleophilia bacterium SCSIO 60948]|nr:hypothetical protein HJD18_13590 [Thermoleophilia bacterium SCSIO 60948]